MAKKYRDGGRGRRQVCEACDQKKKGNSLCRMEIACKYDESKIQVQGERGGKVERKKEGNGGRGGGTDMLGFCNIFGQWPIHSYCLL